MTVINLPKPLEQSLHLIQSLLLAYVFFRQKEWLEVPYSNQIVGIVFVVSILRVFNIVGFSNNCSNDEAATRNTSTVVPPSTPRSSSPNNEDHSDSYLFAHQEFMTTNYHFSPILKGDLMRCQSFAAIEMTDASTIKVLADVKEILIMARKSHTHFGSLYDIREFCMPTFARAKQLIKWMYTCGDLTSECVHSVAVILPVGPSAKLLRSIVEFIIWMISPPMDPRIFTNEEEAMAFLKVRMDLYKTGALALQTPFADNASFGSPPDVSNLPQYEKDFLELGQEPPWNRSRDGRWDRKHVSSFYKLKKTRSTTTAAAAKTK